MVNISDKYKKRIITMFGELGKNWIENVPNIIETYINKINLKNVELIDDSTYNILFYADSDEYGKIVMKIELPFKELTIRESEALKLNNGRGACKGFYSNIDDGILIYNRKTKNISCYGNYIKF